MDIWYNINIFSYDRESKSLHIKQSDMYCDNEGFKYAFPNPGKKFYVKNYKTQGHRCFKLVTRDTDKYTYKSDDDIFLIIESDIKSVFEL